MLIACERTYTWDGSLENMLLAQPERFSTVMQDPENYRVQIIYTQIDRDAENNPVFTSFSYRLNDTEYFYPASTVKLPTALLALEKLNQLDVDGLDRDTTMITLAASNAQSPVYKDGTANSQLPSIGHYIRKIFLVSDNDAFNRLYEFIGQQPLNEAMHAKGYAGTRIMHRLEIALSVAENRHTNPIEFVNGSEPVFTQELQYSEVEFVARKPVLLGVGELLDGTILQRPKDFAEKNAYPLQDQHDVVKSVLFPQSVAEKRRFLLTDDDYRFVYRNMSSYPGDSGIAQYGNSEEFPDGYVKFLLFGGEEKSIPPNIRIFNKVGDAYGFLTDAAYIIDIQNKVEFILAATVYTNANGTFNDDRYEYQEVGLPFMRNLGEAIMEIELQRERRHDADFAWLGVNPAQAAKTGREPQAENRPR